MKLLFTLIFLFLVIGLSGTAQESARKRGYNFELPICYTSGKVEQSFIPPPDEFLYRTKSAGDGANFIVNYIGFPDDAKAAFEYAISIWEALISSSVTIYVEARWQPDSDNILGSCGPTDFFIGFEGAPIPDVYYPVALAEKLMEKEITGAGNPDMLARFNSKIPWYFGTDGKTPFNKYDFVSTVLHEIAHGLGFTGFFYADVSKKLGYSGDNAGAPAVFDIFVQDFQNRYLTNVAIYPNASESLYEAFISNLLYSGSYLGTHWNKGNRPRLYAPRLYNEGSSIYHLNGATYPLQNANSLMTHAAGSGEAIHSPGPITMGILGDMGWKHLYFRFDPPKDREQADEPVLFNVKIESELGLDTASVVLISSKDDFSTPPDTTKFDYDAENELFYSDFTSKTGIGTLSYYLSANDTTGRNFTVPGNAPEFRHTLIIGPDSIKPEISHSNPSYILATDKNYAFEAFVTDNYQVDTVFITLTVNGSESGTIGLAKKDNNLYSGNFLLADYDLQNGGTIEYTLSAIDAAVGKNVRTVPSEGQFSVKVESIFQPLSSYFNDFNNGPADFIEGDFSITQRNGFDNPALHSPNPYPSPEENNKHFNLTSILRYPIIVEQDGAVNFEEVVLVEPGEPGALYGDVEFWDYVIIEATKDSGKTWLPLTDGYDSGTNTSWLSAYNALIKGNNSIAKANNGMYTNRQFSLTENGNFAAGDTIIIRFRLFSDPYANGWGWVIDNLYIQRIVNAKPDNELAGGQILLFPNPFNTHLNISYNGSLPTDNVTIEFYDITGNLLKIFRDESLLPGISSQYSVEDLPAGFYIISVRSTDRIFNRFSMVKR